MASLVMMVMSKVIQRLVMKIMTPLVLMKKPMTMVASGNKLLQPNLVESQVALIILHNINPNNRAHYGGD